MTQLPRVGAAAVILNEEIDAVVLIQRGHEPARGLWSFPGGLVHAGESLHDACRREVLEETGLEVTLHNDPIKLVDRQLHQGGEVKHHFLIVDFLARVRGGSLRAGSDAADAGWIALDRVDQLQTTVGLADALKRACAIARGAAPDQELLSLSIT